MQQFEFKLEPVRALRAEAELEASRALATQLQRMQQGAEHLTRAEATCTRALGIRPVSLATGIELVARQAFLEQAERARDRAAAELADQGVEVERARAELATAANAHEVLERLRRRRQEAYALALQRAEDASLGEIALAGHTARTRASR